MNDAIASVPWKNWVEMFGGSDAARAAIGAQSEQFWRAQAEIVQDLRDLSGVWFERRKEAVATASEAAKAMCACGDPAAAIGVYQQWLASSAGRMAADIAETQNRAAHIAQAWIGAAASAAAAGSASSAAATDRASEQATKPGHGRTTASHRAA